MLQPVMLLVWRNLSRSREYLDQKGASSRKSSMIADNSSVVLLAKQDIPNFEADFLLRTSGESKEMVLLCVLYFPRMCYNRYRYRMFRSSPDLDLKSKKEHVLNSVQ